MSSKEQFIYFWQKKSPFSNWYPSEFEDDDGIIYNCMEQYMMYKKAELFEDKKMMSAILKTKNSSLQKKYGRQVQNFEQKVWENNKKIIVFNGLLYKFNQNKKLLDELKKTKGKTLVEASPYDKIWGIGLSKNNLKAKNRKTWKGKNILGELLTIVRCVILNEDYNSKTTDDYSNLL